MNENEMRQGVVMQNRGRADGDAANDRLLGVSTLGFSSDPSKSIGLSNDISDGDLLSYMADILLELEEMAVFKQLDGVADLLGCAHRAIQRNQQ
jgi:hypothetical protein